LKNEFCANGNNYMDNNPEFISNNLTKKERKELKKEEKFRALQEEKRKKMTKRVALWAGILVLLGGGIFGMVRLASRSPSPASPPLSSVGAISESDWFLGSKNSKVALIEYSDFQCPACKYYHSFIKDLNYEFGEKITFAYRHFPLPQHENAKPASYAAEAAGKQGKFWEMHDLIFENQDRWSSEENTEDLFVNYASGLGLDIEQFKKDIGSETIIDKVNNDFQSGQQARISGTPTFFLNGKKIDNPRDYDEFKKLIEDALQ